MKARLGRERDRQVRATSPCRHFHAGRRLRRVAAFVARLHEMRAPNFARRDLIRSRGRHTRNDRPQFCLI